VPVTIEGMGHALPSSAWPAIVVDAIAEHAVWTE
jgi:hypothetical protein